MNLGEMRLFLIVFMILVFGVVGIGSVAAQSTSSPDLIPIVQGCLNPDATLNNFNLSERNQGNQQAGSHMTTITLEVSCNPEVGGSFDRSAVAQVGAMAPGSTQMVYNNPDPFGFRVTDTQNCFPFVTINVDSSSEVDEGNGEGNNITSLPMCLSVQCRHDLDGNGTIGPGDINELKKDFGRSGQNIAGDVNIDGVVNLLDFAVIFNDFGTSCGGGAQATPTLRQVDLKEPSPSPTLTEVRRQEPTPTQLPNQLF